MLQYNVYVTAGSVLSVRGAAFPCRLLSMGGPCIVQAYSPSEIKGWRPLGPKSAPAGGKSDLLDDIEHVNNNLII